MATALRPALPEAVERETLRLVAGLLSELGGGPAGRPPGPEDRLAADLGLGSLERVELLLRLEAAFGVRLADDVMARAETPRDLARAVMAARPWTPEAPPEARPEPAPACPAPEGAGTLTEVLAWHAAAWSERPHVFLRDEEGREQVLTYGGLAGAGAGVAAALGQAGLRRRQTVALMLRTERAFFEVFVGVLLAGGVPAPIYPPVRADRLADYALRQVGILGNARAELLVTFAEAAGVGGLLRTRVPGLQRVLLAADLTAVEAPPPDLWGAPEDPALIQYTSGSTGAPKGVLLSHANILANIRAMGQALGVAPGDRLVSWLPLYHDMGLIGAWLGALYFGIPAIILSPLAFLARPARWLWAIHAHRATLSPAPNFAFDLCATRVRDEEIRGLDLSSWRLALNGSEPVSPETIERFTRRFAPYGFRAEAMCPVYGLAEASVGLTMPPPGRLPRVDRIAREPFERQRRAVPAPAGEPSPLAFASCGVPLPGHELRLVDAHGRRVPERQEGRIEFRGPSVTGGYFRNPEATRAAVRNGWMDSGDLGYLAGGELFVTGRSKDVIIKAGRNLYPQEIEEIAGQVPGIRTGRVAAFGVPDPTLGTERLVVVAESRQQGAEACRALGGAVQERIAETLGLPPDHVLIAPPGTVLKTPSGKIRRGAMSEAYRRGVLGRPAARAWTQWLRLAGAHAAALGARAGRETARLLWGGWVGILLALTWPPLWMLLALAPGPRAADRLVRGWCRLTLDLAGCRPRVAGLEHLRGRQPAVLVANHESYLDAVVLLAALRADFRFVAKRELLRVPLVGTVIRRVQHLAVERADPGRSARDAERATGLLRAGVSLLFFPEGTFVAGRGLLPFRLGAFKAAVEAGRPVVPVAILGTREILPAEAWLPRPGRPGVVVCAPLAPEGRDWPEMVRLRDRSRAAIARALEEARAA